MWRPVWPIIEESLTWVRVRGGCALRRGAFANDLGDERTLRAVSASSNRSKGDQDPAEWLPPDESFHCRYVEDWVASKATWDLSVDEAERAAIDEVLQGCG